jgi:tRNA pseudouridine55 synthase
MTKVKGMRRTDGILVVDKPGGITSLDVVREVRRRFGIARAGHIGTLDPFATGVLPVALNEGTKLVPFLVEEPKEYEAVLQLGQETTTDDLEGETLLTGNTEKITPEAIRTVLERFRGKLQQVPPMFSAIKVAGQPLYRLARKGIEVERAPREVEVFSVEVGAIEVPRVAFRVSCSRGTYVRALARDAGRLLGCGAHLISLRRTVAGRFDLEKALAWETLKTLSGTDALEPWLIPPEQAVSHLPEVVGDDPLVEKVRFGKEMVLGDFRVDGLPLLKKGQQVRITSRLGGLVAIVRSEIAGVDLASTDVETILFRSLRVFRPQAERNT